MTATMQVGNIGERLVAGWLADRGFTVGMDQDDPEHPGIQARGSLNALLVSVKTAIAPAVPSSLSPEEAQHLKDRAAQLGLEAWEARLQLSRDLQQLGGIQWRKLT